MGKTPKPLCILIHSSIADWEEWEALRAQGHTIVTEQDLRIANIVLVDLDLILGPTSWHMTPKHRVYMKDAIAAARKHRYQKET